MFLKVLLLLFFTSAYNRDLFLPFVNSFIFDSWNPWDYFWQKNIDCFPYHPLMLYILYPFGVLTKITGFEIFFKIPLLLADLLILLVFFKIFPNKKKKILIYYFINPIVIYAIYIHAQLDIIPTSLLMVSIYFLIKEKNILSALMLGLAFSSKINVAFALPLMMIYLYKNKQNILQYCLIVLAVFLIFDLPYLFSGGFINMVIFNQKQNLLFNSYFKIGDLKLYFPIVSVFLTYFFFFNQNKINKDLMFFFFGLLFISLIFFIYPAPAWYIWIIPFLAIYFIQNNNENKNLLLYLAFSALYLVFFIFFYKSDYQDIIFLNQDIDLKISNPHLMNISFSLLQTMLIIIFYGFYRFGIKSNSIYKKSKNLVMGLGGDSGAGKTTLVGLIERFLNNQILVLEGDGEHKWERGNANWDKFTHLNPKANDIYKQSDLIYKLKNNEVVYRKNYNHNTGKFSKEEKTIPKRFILLAGLHSFYLPKIRKNLDFKIYLDTDEDLRVHWKILRDIKKRSYSKEKILEQIEKRMPDTKKYIYPQKAFADFIIKYFPLNEFDIGEENQEINLGLKIILDANIKIEDILEHLNCTYEWDYNEDLKTQYVILKNEPNLDFKDLAFDIVENLEEIISKDITFENGYSGFLQLLLIKTISYKLSEEDEL